MSILALHGIRWNTRYMMAPCYLNIDGRTEMVWIEADKEASNKAYNGVIYPHFRAVRKEDEKVLMSFSSLQIHQGIIGDTVQISRYEGGDVTLFPTYRDTKNFDEEEDEL